MKTGIRKPNLKKSFKAKTTGRMKRQIKKSVNPLYGQKGMGYINNPKKAAYNKVYNKTTVDIRPKLQQSSKQTFTNHTDNKNSELSTQYINENSSFETQRKRKYTFNELKTKRNNHLKKCLITLTIYILLLFLSPLLKLKPLFFANFFLGPLFLIYFVLQSIRYTSKMNFADNESTDIGK